MRPDVKGSERERACAAALMIAGQGVLGLVPAFDSAMQRLTDLMLPHHPGFSWQPVTENASGKRASEFVSPEMRALIEEHNRDDIALLSYASALLRQAETVDRRLQAVGIA